MNAIYAMRCSLEAITFVVMSSKYVFQYVCVCVLLFGLILIMLLAFMLNIFLDGKYSYVFVLGIHVIVVSY